MIEEERRSKTEKRKKENADEEEEKKVCAFHFILCGSTDLVCFGTAISNLGLRRRDKRTKKMTQSGKPTQDELMKSFKFS